ncbi:hypothetical protein GCM10010497_27870 [Streptomyces cinereoruber]|uniref:DUF3040 domain-containing protein n=1 Tax=Streptomyces cinereoruber TaxID=67260 RepID=A0AAV4KMJ0_9ACTN|nr:DUF3040 domain-containing protein [Streptomyces cinereoruber]MBB4160431.1 hypothetical protein [Streptomyces cinereoruber]MBY8818929.1 DUF3040 domain-containing protein [Streptomyces cinereoruber]NIH63050.1 hypothetical protein [Streptomyces cinereoruber]QEV31401.1 DUF3040 domain-containing protein [Streptomyces cinereoruber]GGR24065.1 hypothetical protein GCM10010497_27870 [Streptomyces cinereoruber]
MGDSDEERIADLEAVLRRDDPRFARGPGEGRPRRPREYRRGRAWPAMTLALAAVVVGGLVPNGLLLAAGLVMAALAVNLFDSREQRIRRRRHRHRRGRGPGGPR